MAEKHNIKTKKVIGIGISSPGPVDYKKGLILNPPNLSIFHNYNIVEEVYKRTNLPTKLDVDSVLLSTQESSIYNKLSSIVFLLINDGVGSAFIINNKIFRGNSNFGSELGHTSVDLNGELCSCGNRGCIEHYIKLSNLKKRFNFDNYNEVVDDAYLGKEKALQVIDFIAKYLSSSIINAINLLGIQHVIIYGDFTYRNELLCNKIKKIVNSQSIISKINEIKISFSSLTKDQVLASSTSSIIEAYFNEDYL